MVAYLGMSDKLPNLSYYNPEQDYSFSKPYSDRTSELIDEEVKRLINEQYDRAKALLTEHREGHASLAQVLIDKEVIFAEDVEKIFGKRPWISRSDEIIAENENNQTDTAKDKEADSRKEDEEQNEPDKDSNE